MKFPKGRCEVLDPGQNNDMQLDRATRNRFAEKDLSEEHDGQEAEHQLALCLAIKRVSNILDYVS